jgi:4-azaleucine resistance transporter AzlC
VNESKPLNEFFLGVRDELPILLGVVPFGMIFGILALNAGLSNLEAQAMSSLVFAGSAQFMVAKLLAESTPFFIIVISGFVINLRHALYSATLSPYLKGLSLKWKVLLSYLLTDEAFAVSVIHFQKNEDNNNKHWHLFGSGLTLWTSWQISTAVGIFVGAQIPEAWGLDFALPLTFIALVIPGLKDKPGLLVAATASIFSLFFFPLPFKLGMLMASFLAIGIGIWSEKK